MEWKSPTITKLLGGSGKGWGGTTFAIFRTHWNFIKRSTPIPQRIGWVRSRFISLRGSLQDSTSTFLEADVRFFCLEYWKSAESPITLITEAVARQYGMRTRSSIVVSPVLSTIHCCHLSSAVMSPVLSFLTKVPSWWLCSWTRWRLFSTTCEDYMTSIGRLRIRCTSRVLLPL